MNEQTKINEKGIDIPSTTDTGKRPPLDFSKLKVGVKFLKAPTFIMLKEIK